MHAHRTRHASRCPILREQVPNTHNSAQLAAETSVAAISSNSSNSSISCAVSRSAMFENANMDHIDWKIVEFSRERLLQVLTDVAECRQHKRTLTLSANFGQS